MGCSFIKNRLSYTRLQALSALAALGEENVSSNVPALEQGQEPKEKQGAVSLLSL